MGAAIPIVSYVGNNPIKVEAIPMSINAITRVLFLPIISPK